MTVRPPYGDAFIIQTPYTDRLSQQLYIEQKQRQAFRQQKAAQMDEEFSKNVAGIRDADVDDVTRAYGEWKLMNQAMMKKKGGVTPQDQLELLRKKAEVSKRINASKAGKTEEEDWAKMLGNKPEDFDDNAYDLLSVRRKLPISQISEYRVKTPEGEEQVYNLADLNTFRYKGTDFNFQDAEKKAAGDLKPISGKETLDESGFTYKTPIYEFGNTPAQYKESLMGALATRKGGDAAARLYSKIPQDVIAEVDKAYDAIPKEKLERMGLSELQDLDARNPDNAAEQYAAHMAKLYAINAQPKEGKPVTRRNEQAYIDAQTKKEKELADYKHKLAVALKKTPGAKAEGSEDDDLYIEDYIDEKTKEALPNEGSPEWSKGVEGIMEINPMISKALVKQGLEPEYITVTPDGKYTPKYFIVDQKGNKILQEDLSRPMSKTDLLLTLGVKITTGKKRYKEAKSAVENSKSGKKEDLRTKYNY